MEGHRTPGSWVGGGVVRSRGERDAHGANRSIWIAALASPTVRATQQR